MKKEIKVVMLPTEKASWVIEDKKGKLHMPILRPLSRHDLLRANPANHDNIPQHLYFLSDEEIKEGDWIIWENKVVKAINTSYWSAKKIIATTDESLRWHQDNEIQIIDTYHCKFPRPSNEFLKKYCELGGIDKVLVEYDCPQCKDYGFISECRSNCNQRFLELKVAPDNTISIYPIES